MATILVMNVFKAAQPALLYLVPAIIGALALHAAWLKSFKEVRPPQQDGRTQKLAQSRQNIVCHKLAEHFKT